MNILTRYSSSWSSRLNLARVTHWGGMISTPDVILQESIKTALIDNGCPLEITEQLMENAHERHWPEGLATLGKILRFIRLMNSFVLETRQDNRQYYESYVCRRIIDKQAVVILSCDNRHMNASMSMWKRERDESRLIWICLVAEPGLVIIFSHGVK